MKSRINNKQQNEDIVLELVNDKKAILNHSGGKKLYFLIKDEIKKLGIKMGRDKFLKLLKNNNLNVNKKTFNKPKTDSNHPFRKHKNLIKDLTVDQPDQVWVSDITYIKVNGKWKYLTLITDLFSRKIVGFSFSNGMSVKETTFTAMEMAIKHRKKKRKTILHSDRGFQYCNPNFIKHFKPFGIIPSMTNNGNPYENAVAERVNGILKYEFDLRFNLPNFCIALNEIKKAIHIYNNIRPHWSLNLNTPHFIYKNPNSLNIEKLSLS